MPSQEAFSGRTEKLAAGEAARANYPGFSQGMPSGTITMIEATKLNPNLRETGLPTMGG